MVPLRVGMLRHLVPRPGVLKIRTKQNQIHQKKANNFGLFLPRALPQVVHFRLVFRLSLPKFCPRIFAGRLARLEILHAFVFQPKTRHWVVGEYIRDEPLTALAIAVAAAFVVGGVVNPRLGLTMLTIVGRIAHCSVAPV